MAYITRILYPTASALIQLSLLSFYWRLLKGAHGTRYRTIVKLAFAFVTISWLIFLSLSVFTCLLVFRTAFIHVFSDPSNLS